MLPKFKIVENGIRTYTMDDETAYCRLGINVHRRNAQGMIRKGYYRYEITPID